MRDPHCTNLNRHCCICVNLLGKRTLAKEKYITQLNSVFFIKIIKDLQYYILPRYAWNAVFLWVQPIKNENWCPYDNHSYSTCERVAKLDYEHQQKWPKCLYISFEIQPINPEVKANQSTTKRRKTELWYANINI